MDKYLVELNRIATDIEHLCGLSLITADGVAVGAMDMDDVVAYCSQNSSKLSPTALKDLNVGVGRKAVLLSYLSDRLHFYGKKKLDFSAIPCMKELASLLIQFTEKKNLSNDLLKGLNRSVMILTEVDHKDRTVKKTLGYRFLRIFLLLVVYGNNCNASVVANLILEQLVVGA